MNLVELVNVTKLFKKQVVIKDFNHLFASGKCYLLVGENGCGKTTIIKLIMGFIKPNSGMIVKKDISINYVPDKINFPDYLSIYDFLYNIGLIKGVKKTNLKSIILKELENWGLIGHMKKNLQALSKGMMQKVLIIQSLITDADLYIFDESLSGLDVSSQKQFIKSVLELKSRDKGIIIISHQKESFLELADEIIEMEKMYELD